MRGLKNWKYEEVVAFLKANGFKECRTRGSHHYFKKSLRRTEYLVHVQYHAKQTIPIGTMKAIVNTSGIPEEKWRNK